MSEEIGILNDREDFDEDERIRVQFYEIKVEMPTYTIRVYAETPEDAEDMALDHFHETFSFSDLMGCADVFTKEVS